MTSTYHPVNSPPSRMREEFSRIREQVSRARGQVYVGLVVVAYALSSLGGVFVNKATLSAYDFGYPFTLMAAQLSVSIVALNMLRLFGFLELPKRTWRELSYLCVPSVFFILNVTVGLLALKLVNIPMFSAFRRLSVVNVMILEYFVLGKLASSKVIYTIMFMSFGSLIAAFGDLTFDPIGYILVFLNNFITGGNLVSIKKVSNVVNLSALPLFYYVSSISLPIVALVAYSSGELAQATEAFRTRPELNTYGFALALSLSAASAFMINFFTNLCTQVTSALATAITGQTKNILQTILGIFAWGYKASFLNLLGLALALVGSCLFAWVKWNESRAPPQQPIPPGASPASAAASPASTTVPANNIPAGAVAGAGAVSDRDIAISVALDEYKEKTVGSPEKRDPKR